MWKCKCKCIDLLLHFLTDSVKEKKRQETQGIDKERKKEEIAKPL